MTLSALVYPNWSFVLEEMYPIAQNKSPAVFAPLRKHVRKINSILRIKTSKRTPIIYTENTHTHTKANASSPNKQAKLNAKRDAHRIQTHATRCTSFKHQHTNRAISIKRGRKTKLRQTTERAHFQLSRRIRQPCGDNSRTSRSIFFLPRSSSVSVLRQRRRF